MGVFTYWVIFGGVFFLDFTFNAGPSIEKYCQERYKMERVLQEGAQQIHSLAVLNWMAWHWGILYTLGHIETLNKRLTAYVLCLTKSDDLEIVN